MFQSVRPNSQIYIYHKGTTHTLDIGYVVNQPVPKPKYTVPPMYGQPQEMIVDLTIKVGNNTLNFNSLPANVDIADSFSNGENIVVSTNKEAMNAEILSTKQKYLDILNSRELNESIVASCDVAIKQLNPEYAEKQSQKEEIQSLKDQVSNLTSMMSNLIDSLKKE